MVDVSIVIVNYRTRGMVKQGLRSIREAKLALHYEVFVVDNGSHDGLPELVRARFPEVRLIALEKNVGFAAGNNLGAQSADTEYLVFLNNDTRPQPGWLAALLRVIEQHSSIGLVTSRIVYLDSPGIVDSAGDGYLRVGGAFKHGHGGPVADVEQSREVFGACGAAFIIRRSLFAALGGFDEDFFMVYEDVDLSYRARLLGWRVMYAHDAIVEHAGSASMGRASDTAAFYGQRNLEWTWVKNTPRRLLWRTAIGHLFYDIAGGAAYARRGQAGVWLRAKWSAVRGLGPMLAKRRAQQRSATADPASLWAVMDAGWVGVKRREKGFDFAPQTAPRP